jgi:thiosulfate/3-mercaptopyruvate sulfurtransferase
LREKSIVMHTTLVSTDTLSAHLDAGWAVVDCRFELQREDWGHAQYLAAHIPGALYASLNDDLSATRSGANGRHPLPSPEAMAATFGRLGITAGPQVVAYDQDSGMFASRLWWMLRYCGHDAVAVLDGGWAKWTREGRPTRTDDDTRPPASFVPHIRRDARLTVDQVEQLVGRPEVLLVDARGPERFEGRTEPLDRVAGHIPGARNHYYKLNVADDGTMLPAERLRAEFDRTLQGRPPAETVLYCGSGVSACHNLLAMEHAGLPGARLYPGSWSEWSADSTRPVATGSDE